MSVYSVLKRTARYSRNRTVWFEIKGAHVRYRLTGWARWPVEYLIRQYPFLTGSTGSTGKPANQHRKEKPLLPEKQKNKYRQFYDSARNNDILEPKTTLMLHMATAMAVGCYP